MGTERETITTEVGKVSDWLDEEADMQTPIEEFTAKLKVLKDLAAPMFARVREHRERPEALENLRQSLNNSNTFLTKSRENTEKTEERRVFSRRRSWTCLRRRL